MALQKGFTPSQFRDAFLGTVGFQQISVTPPSTSNGAFTKLSAQAVVGGFAPGDIVFAWLNTPVSGVIVDAQVTAVNTVELFFFNESGSTYNPGAGQLVNLIGLRAKTA